MPAFLLLPSRLALLATTTTRSLLLPSSNVLLARSISSTPPTRTTMPSSPPPTSPSSQINVAKGISLFPGSEDDGAKARGDPKMVVLCGWMGAAPAHLKKYVNLHQDVFPGVPVLVLRSEPSAFFQSERTRWEELKGAVELVPREGGVFYHACSNGGTLKLTDLVNLLPSPPSSFSSQHNVLLLDSTPGTASHSRTIQAFLLPFPSLLPFLPTALALGIGRTFLSLVYVLNRSFHWITRTPDAIELTRTKLQEQFPVESVGRAYVYSKEDELIDWRDVERHGREAGGEGKVRMERFEGSQHVAHLRKDGERYARVMRELWEGRGREGEREILKE